jgi:hypothetical protein
MSARILLAIACAAALLIGLTVWLRVDQRAPASIDVAADDAATTSPSAELITPVTESAPADSRTAAPAASIRPAPVSTSSAADRRPLARIPRLSGLVQESGNGGPLQSATIMAQLEGETDDQGAKFIQLTTDQRGMYSASFLAAGDWLVTCGARGHVNGNLRVKIEADKEARADFVLAPEPRQADLVVHLRATDGRPLFETLDGADLEAARALRPVFVSACPSRGEILSGANSVLPIRASGVHAPRADEWFEVKLDETTNGCCCLALADRVLDAVPFDASSHDVVLVAARADLQRAMGSLRCSVVDDASGQPLSAGLSIRPAAGAAQSLATDANGSVRAAPVIEGEARVVVNAMNHAAVIRMITIERGKELDLGVIRLKANVSISGRVVMPAGIEPWPSVFAHRIAEDKHGAEEEARSGGRVESDAQFTIKNLEPGMYVVGWQGPSVPDLKPIESGLIQGWAIVDARSGSVQGVQIVITKDMLKSESANARARAH